MDLNDINSILKELNSLPTGNISTCSGISRQRIAKLKATQTTNELEQIYHLTDSHVVSLRERACNIYARLTASKELQDESEEQLSTFIDILKTESYPNIPNTITKLKRWIYEMPAEWTIVQITSDYNWMEPQNIDINQYYVNGLYISVFDCGQNKIDPFLVKIDPPTINRKQANILQELVDVFKKFQDFLNDPKHKADARLFNSHFEHCESACEEVLEKCERKMLREWRCLLIGKYTDKSAETFVRNGLKSLLTERLTDTKIKEKTKELLHRVVKAGKDLNEGEVSKAVKYCLSDYTSDKNILSTVVDGIKQLRSALFVKYKKPSRHPVILIVDECLDMVPWEMMDILRDAPTTRLPSLHFVQFLFKAHETAIKNGHKIVENYHNGRFLLNPDGNLAKSETRCTSFLSYWLKQWQGVTGRHPTDEEFQTFLKNADVYAYYGHGNGTHMINIDQIKDIKVNAVVLLFGCASVKFNRLGPQVEMHSSHNMYLMARCPAIVGMLWPVMDTPTDEFSSILLSIWLKSEAPVHWQKVDKSEWKKGRNLIEQFKETQSFQSEPASDRSLSGALNKARNDCSSFLMRAACVIRGLPVEVKLS